MLESERNKSPAESVAQVPARAEAPVAGYWLALTAGRDGGEFFPPAPYGPRFAVCYLLIGIFYNLFSMVIKQLHIHIFSLTCVYINISTALPIFNTDSHRLQLISQETQKELAVH